MRDRIQKILDRECERLEALSNATGLDLDEFRKLDLLIKAVKSLRTDLAEDALSQSKESEPTNEELIRLLNDASQGKQRQ
jgi:hypothetical protein